MLEKREHPFKENSLAFPALQWRAADLNTHPIADLKLEMASPEETAIRLRATLADSTQSETTVRLQPFPLLLAIANGVWVSGSSPHAEIAYPVPQPKDGKILIAEFSISQDELDKIVTACAKRLGIANTHDLLSILKEQEKNISPKHLCRRSPFSTIASPLVTVIRKSIETESTSQVIARQDHDWQAAQERLREQTTALQQKWEELDQQIERAFQSPASPPQQQAPTRDQSSEGDLPPQPKPEYWPTPEQIVQMTIINSLVPLL